MALWTKYRYAKERKGFPFYDTENRPIGLMVIYAELRTMAITWKKKYNEVFGENLKGLRNSKKLTQQQLSKRSGVSLSHISRIERGLRGPKVTTIAHLAFGMKVEPATLLDFKFQNEK